MADIELVIKIPEEKYNKLVMKEEHIRACGSYYPVMILDGIPLPKGHGDLIDVGQCDRKLFYQQCGGADSLITVKSAFDMLMSLPAIIEADTESEEV